MKKLAIHWKILIALVLAFLIGLWANFNTESLAEKPSWFNHLHYFSNFFGSLFINALKMVVIPLVMTSIICGVAKIGEDKDFGRLGLKTLFFYSLTGLLAVVVGLLCVNLIEPGQVDAELREKMLGGQGTMEDKKVEKAFENADGGFKGIIEIFQRMIPQNLFKAAVEGQLLGLIFFSLLFGFFVARLPAKYKESQILFWEGLNATILRITNFIISFAPYGVFGLVTPTLMMVGIETVYVMGTFALTVLLGLAIHSFIVLPFLLRFLAKLNFIKHFQAVSPALLTAFSTASSSSTLPVTLNCGSCVSRSTIWYRNGLGHSINGCYYGFAHFNRSGRYSLS
jgi:Na+/H+-dicarboxylate symporter